MCVCVCCLCVFWIGLFFSRLSSSFIPGPYPGQQFTLDQKRGRPGPFVCQLGWVFTFCMNFRLSGAWNLNKLCKYFVFDMNVKLLYLLFLLSARFCLWLCISVSVSVSFSVSCSAQIKTNLNTELHLLITQNTVQPTFEAGPDYTALIPKRNFFFRPPSSPSKANLQKAMPEGRKGGKHFVNLFGKLLASVGTGTAFYAMAAYKYATWDVCRTRKELELGAGSVWAKT